MSEKAEYTITIQSLVYGGNGLGRLPDGKAVFVPFVLPGETVRVRIREEKKRHAFADLIEIVEKHADRIEPKCAHYGQCGGCHYQHVADRDQIEFKRVIFLEQLERMGGLETLPQCKVIPAVKQWGYRNTIQFHTTKDGELAYMDTADANPFPVRECWLPMQDIAAFWPQIALEADNSFERIELRQNIAGDLQVILHSENAEIPEIEITHPISAVHLSGLDMVTLSGDPYLEQAVNGEQFIVSAGSFFQTNLNGAAALVQTVREVAPSSGGTLLDLYCGVGLFSRVLAERFDQVIGVEVSASACDDFEQNMGSFDHISLYQGAAERVLPDLDIKADCIVVDPPRKGIDRFALDAIIASQAPQIIYVSCDPSTLGRDIKRMFKAGYSLDRSVVIDMFPQTFHIESVNLLTLR